MEKASFSMQLSRYASAYNPSVSATPRQLPLHKGAFGRQSPCDLRPEMLRSDGTRDRSIASAICAPTPFFSPTPSRPLNLDPVFAWLVKFLTSHHLFLSARGFAEGLRSAAGHRLPLTREVDRRQPRRRERKVQALQAAVGKPPVFSPSVIFLRKCQLPHQREPFGGSRARTIASAICAPTSIAALRITFCAP